MSAQPQFVHTETFPDRLLINGELVPGAASMDVINPATGKTLTRCPRADLDQLNAAVAAGKAAFPAWSRKSWDERKQLLTKLAEALAAQHEEFARLMTLEQGKPLDQARYEIGGAIAMIHAFTQMKIEPKVLREDADHKIVQQRAPLGVVAAITPWNFPMILLMIKLAPGLISGNTMVAKPAPTTPLTTLKFGELAAKILPPGVLNIITDQNDLGTALTQHPDIAKVAFTGSTATGRKVMASVAGTIKRITLELGGNDAAIILPGTNAKEVAPKIFMGAMMNAGQICLAIKRVYAHESIYEELCTELARLANEAVVGDGMKPGTLIGPVQNRTQYEKVKEYIADGAARGKIIAGGKTLPGDGYFIAPTIVRDIPDDARLVREEQFGPVMPVMKYTDVDDAIARANSTEYGLGGTVWGPDLAQAYEVASRMDTGTVWVNKHLDLPPDIPFAGAKQSGLGAEMGPEGLEEFTQPRVINLAKH
jgi:acyl-CoA reductase-like NAD-dependent aldehyde dehydrogenase